MPRSVAPAKKLAPAKKPMRPQAPPRSPWVTKFGDGYGADGPSSIVAQLQTRLGEVGHPVPVDGQYGPTTHAAVQAFQLKHNLSPQQGVDSATTELLRTPPHHALARVRGAKAAATKAIRRADNAKKIARNAEGLASHVKKIQRAHGLTPDGVIGPKTAGVIIGLAMPSKKTDVEEAKPWSEALHPRGRGGKWVSAGVVHDVLRGAGFKPATTDEGFHVYETPGGQVKAQWKMGVAGWSGRVSDPQREANQRARMAVALAREGFEVKRSGKAILIKEPKEAQESTLQFGYGGDYSRSIPDARDRVPEYDLPIWTRTGQRVQRNVQIPDSRNTMPVTDFVARLNHYAGLRVALTETIEARKAARDGFEFARARAREEVLRSWLEEAGAILVSRAARINAPSVRGGGGPVHHEEFMPEAHHEGLGHLFKEALHPRGRGGLWIDKPGSDAGAYFDLSQPHDMRRVEELATRQDPPEHLERAGNYMDKAARGEIEKRGPIKVHREPDGTMRVIDGNSTVQVARQRGLTHIPVQEVQLGELDDRALAKRLRDESTSIEEKREIQRLLNARGVTGMPPPKAIKVIR